MLFLKSGKPTSKENDCLCAWYKVSALLIGCLLSGGVPAYAQKRSARFADIDSTVARFSRQAYRPDSVVAFVKASFSGDSSRARAFYSWIAMNVEYDKSLLDQYKITTALISDFRPGGRSQHADTVLLHRKAVCEGLCNVMNRFCGEAGITSVLVPGITRDPEGEVQEKILHTWNAVKISGKWQLLDITWSGGFVNSRDQYVRKFSGKFFFTPPADFIRTHWPLDAMWQLLEQPVTKKEFFSASPAGTKQTFHFKDSIAAYMQLDEYDREYADLQHFHHNDPDNAIYTEGCDRFVYNRAATLFNRGVLFFEDYLAYARTLKGKEIGMKEVRRCLRLLEEPRQNLEQGLKFSANKRFFHNDIRSQFEGMVQKSTRLLVEINGFVREYRKMEAALK